jgi:hypothetical protein
MEEIKVEELKGLNIGDLYQLAFMQTRAKIERVRKFMGYYQARKLFIEPDGSFLIESLPHA